MSVTKIGKNSIYEVQSLVPTVIYQLLEDNYMSEKSISGVKAEVRELRWSLECFMGPVSRVMICVCLDWVSR